MTTEDVLHDSTREANERKELIRSVTAMNLTGPGVVELLRSPTDQLRQYVESPDEAQRFVRLYNQQEKALDRLRSHADGDYLLDTMREAVAIQREVAATLRRIEASLDRQERRADRTGRNIVGDAAGRAMRNGRRG